MLQRALGAPNHVSSAENISPEYASGQVWRYNTREGESESRLYLVRVDELSNGESAYHIFLDSVSIINPHTDSGIQQVLPHAPVARVTLDSSVTELEETDAEMPDIDRGYMIWREAYDAGEAGIYTVEVREILDLIEQTRADQ